MQYGQQPVFAYTATPAVHGLYGTRPHQVYQIQQPNLAVARVYSMNDAKAIVSLSIVQLVVGLMCIVFQSGAMSIEHQQNQSGGIATSEYMGYGIWCGAMYIGTGILGVLTGKKNVSSCIAGVLAFNVICSVITWVQIGFAAANLECLRICQNSLTINYNFYKSYSNGCRGPSYAAWIALDSLLLILSIIEFTISVASASICCSVLGCCCCSTSSVQPTYAVQQPATTSLHTNCYQMLHTNPSQSMMTVPVGYLNQSFATGYTAQPPAPAFGQAQEATINIPPMAIATTNYAHTALAPPPYHLYQDMTGGSSPSANSSHGNSQVFGKQRCQDHTAEPPISVDNVEGSVYTSIDFQQTYENCTEYETQTDQL